MVGRTKYLVVPGEGARVRGESALALAAAATAGPPVAHQPSSVITNKLNFAITPSLHHATQA